MSTGTLEEAKPQEKVWKLSALDRCDRCSAQAYVEVTLKTGGKLLFCNHDYNIHKDALLPKIVEEDTVDETERLTEGNRHKGSANS